MSSNQSSSKESSQTTIVSKEESESKSSSSGSSKASPSSESNNKSESKGNLSFYFYPTYLGVIDFTLDSNAQKSEESKNVSLDFKNDEGVLPSYL